MNASRGRIKEGWLGSRELAANAQEATIGHCCAKCHQTLAITAIFSLCCHKYWISSRLRGCRTLMAEATWLAPLHFYDNLDTWFSRCILVWLKNYESMKNFDENVVGTFFANGLAPSSVIKQLFSNSLFRVSTLRPSSEAVLLTLPLVWNSFTIQSVFLFPLFSSFLYWHFNVLSIRRLQISEK